MISRTYGLCGSAVEATEGTHWYCARYWSELQLRFSSALPLLQQQLARVSNQGVCWGFSMSIGYIKNPSYGETYSGTQYG